LSIWVLFPHDYLTDFSGLPVSDSRLSYWNITLALLDLPEWLLVPFISFSTRAPSLVFSVFMGSITKDYYLLTLRFWFGIGGECLFDLGGLHELGAAAIALVILGENGFGFKVTCLPSSAKTVFYLNA
jgi:hypothetical protein